MTKPVEIFDRVMWDTFSGCTSWPTSAQGDSDQFREPISREFDAWLVIADAETVVAFQHDDERQIEWQLCVKFPTQLAARAFLNGLPSGFGRSDGYYGPEAYGFRPCGGN